MKISYSSHAELRMRQKGITRLEVEHVLKHAKEKRHVKKGRMVASGSVKDKSFRVIYKEKKNYIRIITIR